MADTNDRIVPLDELDDFQVAEGDPDVRGWEVFASDSRKIGEVEDLLIDTAAMKVRYLDVELDDELLGSGQDRHVLIPIGYARLHENDDHIFVDELASTDVGTIPAYTHEPLTHEYETTVVQHYNPGYTTSTGAGLYDLDLYDDNRFYGSRRENPLA
jgi:photosynthetic reaction center H subunit